ncbi:MAG TPA: SLBB domain-containing protein [Verrucomicrobiales bacterium]|nr:SLBB domain-containing protein [Verrucomicrobiales bacterium]
MTRSLSISLAAAAVLTGCTLPPRDATNVFDPRADATGAVDAGKDPTFATFSSGRRVTASMRSPNQRAFTLGPGDQIEIQLEGQPETIEQTLVMPDGLVYYYLAEGVPAENRTVEELRLALTEELAQYEQNPLLNVTLTDVQSRNYWILGQVVSPGTYSLNQPTTLVQALAKAGGIDDRSADPNSSRANLAAAYMVRNGETLPVDLERLVRHGDMSQNVYLEPGDYVYVPSSQDASVYVLGDVPRPSSVGYRNNLTMVAAIAQAGGLNPTAYKQKLVIIRGALYEPSVAVVNFDDIIKGQATNFQLHPGDIVWVSKSPFQLTKNFVFRIADAAARAVAVTEGVQLVDPGSPRGPAIGIN